MCLWCAGPAREGGCEATTISLRQLSHAHKRKVLGPTHLDSYLISTASFFCLWTDPAGPCWTVCMGKSGSHCSVLYDMGSGHDWHAMKYKVQECVVAISKMMVS